MGPARRIILLASLLASLLAGPPPSVAQAPAPVPALPDAARLTSYTLAGSLCVCAVGFAIYGDSTDVDEWIQVYIGTTRYLSTDPTFGWSLSSATGPLATIPRPINDAVLTFNANQSGTLTIVGARRPRRISQFAENRGVAARDLNQAITDQTAMLREAWDKLQGAIIGQPGESILRLPPAATRANQVLAFDANGNPTVVSVPASIPSGQVTGPVSSTIGHPATWGNTLGTALVDTPVLGVPVGGTGQSSLTANGVLLGNGTSGVGVATIGTGGNVLIDQGAGNPPAFKTVSGAITINSSGVASLGATLPPFTNPVVLSGNPLLTLNGSGQLNVSNASQNALQFQGTGNSLTTSILLNPGSGTLSSGTITELVIGQTNSQAFGGNYGRFSFSNFEGLSGLSGIVGEFGGTVTPSDFDLQVAYENPANTFNTAFFWHAVSGTTTAEDYQTGQVQFGAAGAASSNIRPSNGVVPNVIALTMPNLATAGTQDSNSILWEGKAYDGTTQRAVWWRQNAHVSAQAGTSQFKLQRNLNGAGWTDALIIPDNVALDLPSGAGTAGAALTSSGSGSTQATWQIPARMRYCLVGVNFNSANTDNALSISPLPTVRWAAGNVRITNASASISSATVGVFTATGGGGQTIAANQAITVTASATDSNNNTMALNLTNGTTEAYNDTSVQVRVGTAQGSAATADVCLEIVPLT